MLNIYKVKFSNGIAKANQTSINEVNNTIKYYNSIQEGMAVTKVGESFLVLVPDEAPQYYLHTVEGAVIIETPTEDDQEPQ